MLSLCQSDLLPRKLETVDLSRLLPFCQRYLRRLWLGSWVIFWRVTVYCLLFSFRIVRASEHVMLCSQCLPIYRSLWTWGYLNSLRNLLPMKAASNLC